MKTEYKYIQFVKLPQNPKKKTEEWNCCSIATGYELAIIEWYGQWKQYVFAPEDNMIFSAGCLDDISHFIKQLMDERKPNHKG